MALDRFRSIAAFCRAMLSPYQNANLINSQSYADPEDLVYVRNGDLACDPFGQLFTRKPSDALPLSPVWLPQGWQWDRQFGAANRTVVASSGTLNDATRPLIRFIDAIAGDPAIAFDANPIYLQIHYATLTPGATPRFTFPVPPPPERLFVDFRERYDMPIVGGVAAPLAYSLIWAFSTTQDTYTAGPTGTVFINYAMAQGSLSG